MDLIVSRGDDPGQQHLGRLAGRTGVPASTAARPAWRPASRCAWASSPHRTPAWAWRSTPGPPRRCAATSTWSTSGRSSPARATAAPPRWPAPFKPRTRRCSRSSRPSTPPTPRTTTSSTASSASGRCAGCEQNGVAELDAAVMKDGLVRAETLPLVFRAWRCEPCRAARAVLRAHHRHRPADAGPARQTCARWPGWTTRASRRRRIAGPATDRRGERTPPGRTLAIRRGR